MKFIEEVVVEEFLPTFRSMLAEDLRARGLTQSEVASALGISQSAVSKYAHGEVARNDRIETDDRVRALVERVGEGLASGDMTPVQALVESEVLVRRLERGDILADLHEGAMPALAAVDHARIHDPDSAVRATERVRSSVRRGVRTLTNASGFSTLIPNVGSNLVECLPEATGVEDVAAVPGRIFDVKGQATVPGDPEFGVSEYVASVLLAAREHTDARAAANIRYDPDLVDALADAGYTCLAFEPDGDSEVEGVRSVLADAPELTDVFVLYQTGGYGIEPITYLLGPDAPTVADCVRDLL
ncbi:DNA-binding protein [Salinigranum rubrum]|uniref:DNA-binding protein n=1 Tax=Salinigranum rubrum TaxID=755307 RepID=A0A2I8VG68_9EURY|nr:thiamine-phosphate synthase family protein [Salinigranum rubrum]AUV80925.1 DNA-binding protein [Salinigranum rubrum]